MKIYVCCDERRRDAVRAQHTLKGVDFNGIDYLEVVDARTLLVHFIHALRPGVLGKENVRITGGERIRDLTVVSAAIRPEKAIAESAASTTGAAVSSTEVAVAGAETTDISVLRRSRSRVLRVTVDRPGDYSTYTLRLSADPAQLRLDPLLSTIDFTFDHPAGRLDCRTAELCLPDAQAAPEIDYLAKDFTSFRQLMLDRLSVLMPAWKERSAADVGVMLVELLAYVADHLSYQQDVIATESYLSTARRRVSVRRHARLLDYAIDEGCNARVWVQVQVERDVVSAAPGTPVLPKGTRLLTQVAGQSRVVLSSGVQVSYQNPSMQPVVFETMENVKGLFAAHNQLSFYTWGARECCLPKGATHATLRGALPDLKPGDVLIFKELVDPRTGAEADAQPAHRHAVRLTKVLPGSDPLGMWPVERSGAAGDRSNVGKVIAEFTVVREPDYSLDVTEIEWGYADALPFPLCVSAVTDYDTTDPEHGHRYVENVSVALGNIVLADHGKTVENLDGTLIPNRVPKSTLDWAAPANGRQCDQSRPAQVPPRFYPRLTYTPLTFAVPYDAGDATLSATEIMQFGARDAVAAITLKSTMVSKDGSIVDRVPLCWSPRRDLLNSSPTDAHFVVEVEADGAACLRFGDDRHGTRPDANTRFQATYRVGIGAAGNIGRDSLCHILSDDPQLLEAIGAVNNPLPASGGVDPESIEDIRQNAAGSFTLPERGITPRDYVDIVIRETQLQVHQANAMLRWTGSWYTMFLAVERAGNMPADDAFTGRLRQRLEQYRMAGTDLVIVAPAYVALEVVMSVSVKPGYLPDNVKTALLKTFSNRQWPDGERGVFYPDNYTFGQPVYLNPLYAAAGAVPGVDSVTITSFQRQGLAGTGLADGVLVMAWFEIPILENNPHYPERGLFGLTVAARDLEMQHV